MHEVGIVGLGLIGGSVALAARALGKTVLGYDEDPETRREAEARGLLDRAVLRPEDLLDCAVVFVAVPLQRTTEALTELRGAQAVVTDCASVKGPIVAWAKEQHDPGLSHRFVPGHPMAGHELGGQANASARLFEGAPWLLTPIEGSDASAVEAVEELVRTFGALPMRLSPAEHDRAVAHVSHLPHLVANALVRSAGDHERFGGGSWRDTTRVAGSTSAMWREILKMNRAEAISALDSLGDELAALRELIDIGDYEGLEAYWKQVQRQKGASQQTPN